MPTMTERHWLRRWIELSLALVCFVLAVLIAPLPGPGGVFPFAAGMVLLLRNSRRARVRFARAKRRWPRAGQVIDRTMRRPSALRRHARQQRERLG